jgi:hypothetical protein
VAVCTSSNIGVHNQAAIQKQKYDDSSTQTKNTFHFQQFLEVKKKIDQLTGNQKAKNRQ